MTTKKQGKKQGITHQLKETFGAVVWLVVSWLLVNGIVLGMAFSLTSVGVDINEVFAGNVARVGLSAFTYVLLFAGIFLLPKLFKTPFISKKALGWRRLKWSHVGFGVLGIVIYYVFTIVMSVLAVQLMPWMNVNQKQDVGIIPTAVPWELVLIFILLVVVAPIAEELIFRGYLYGRIRASGVPFVVVALIVSVLFGLAHGQWNVGVDTFAMSIVICVMREITGSITPGIIMHMIKNGLAFYLLFFTDIAQKVIGG